MSKPEPHCSKIIYRGSYMGHPCSRRKNLILRKGKLYCAQHDPEAVKKRMAKRDAKWDAEWAQKQRRWNREAAGLKALELIEKMTAGKVPVLPIDWEKKAKRIIKAANKRVQR